MNLISRTTQENNDNICIIHLKDTKFYYGVLDDIQMFSISKHLESGKDDCLNFDRVDKTNNEWNITSSIICRISDISCIEIIENLNVVKDEAKTSEDE